MSALRNLRTVAHAFKSVSAPRALTAARVARPVMRQATRTFAVSARARTDTATELALSQKLQEELKYEEDALAAAESNTPEFLTKFLEEGVWTLNAATGSDEVTLSRKFGNENIRVIYSLADLDSDANEPFDEEGQGEEGEEAEPPLGGSPIRVSITITKDGKPGALVVDAVAQDGSFVCDNIAYYADGSLATDLTPDADWRRRGLYIGPRFDQLDISVQEEFEKFLAERGIDESLAMFVPDYAEYREQEEYVHWLKNVRQFVDA